MGGSALPWALGRATQAEDGWVPSKGPAQHPSPSPQALGLSGQELAGSCALTLRQLPEWWVGSVQLCV